MKHAAHSHTIALDYPPARVFPLFTPEGEKLWIKGWAPRYLHPASGETTEGMVFVTGEGAELTYWNLVRWDPAGGRARYARVTPASRFGLVDVACDAEGAKGSRVTVGYAFTALTPEGERFLADLGTAKFREMIEGWRQLLLAYLDAPSSSADARQR